MSEKSLLPFLILGLGFVWMGLFKWLRHRAQAKPPTETPAQDPQHFDLLGVAGLFVCMTAAAVTAYVKWMQ